VDFLCNLAFYTRLTAMILIYTPEITPRSAYIFDLLLTDILGIAFRVTSQAIEYEEYSGPKINYSADFKEEGLFIPPVGLLNETGISPRDPDLSYVEETPVLFPVEDIRASLAFDIFSAAFYLVTRYEEYSPVERDIAGRYRPEESLACRHNFLHLPLVNIWADQLYRLLQKWYPGYSSRRPAFRFVPTFDIDHAYAYRQRGFLRSTGGYIRSLYRRQWIDLKARTKVLLNLVPDPFDVYDHVLDLHLRYGLHPIYFILFADYGGDDNGVMTNGRLFQQLLLKLDEQGAIGIHPSRASNRDFSLLESELFGLSNYIGRDISLSRQHFLMVSFPETYKRLIQVGITDDFSLGYASVNGFRASIASPFMFFDLETESRTELKVHPFAFMDVTYRNYLKTGVRESFDQMRSLVDTVKSVNGELVSLWHNESLSETEGWNGWRGLYESFLEYVMK
jgi:hypothetical protein